MCTYVSLNRFLENKGSRSSITFSPLDQFDSNLYLHFKTMPRPTKRKLHLTSISTAKRQKLTLVEEDQRQALEDQHGQALEQEQAWEQGARLV
jgi:hypothetical protein